MIVCNACTGTVQLVARSTWMPGDVSGSYSLRRWNIASHRGDFFISLMISYDVSRVFMVLQPLIASEQARFKAMPIAMCVQCSWRITHTLSCSRHRWSTIIALSSEFVDWNVHPQQDVMYDNQQYCCFCATHFIQANKCFMSLQFVIKPSKADYYLFLSQLWSKREHFELM